MQGAFFVIFFWEKVEQMMCGVEGVSNNISSLPGGSDGIVWGYRGQIATNDLGGATHYFFKLLFTLLYEAIANTAIQINYSKLVINKHWQFCNLRLLLCFAWQHNSMRMIINRFARQEMTINALKPKKKHLKKFAEIQINVQVKHRSRKTSKC